MDLSIFFTTKAGATDFSTRLAAICEDMYRTNFELEKELMNQFGIKKKDIFTTFLRENKINTESLADVKTFLKHMQEIIAAIPVLSLTLAFEPNEQTLKAISDWFIINQKKQILFDFTINPGLIAGAAITFSGKFKDFSIKAKFDTIFQDALNTNGPAKTTTEHQSAEGISIAR